MVATGGERLTQPDGLRAEVLRLGGEQVERADDLAAQPHRQGMDGLETRTSGRVFFLASP
jgi:hypothetical protein